MLVYIHVMLLEILIVFNECHIILSLRLMELICWCVDNDDYVNNQYCFQFCSPRVTVAAYTIPHPSLEQVNIRVQTTGDPAREVFKDACQELMQMNRHVRSVFDKAVAEYKDEQKRKEEAEEEELKRQRDLFGSMDIENN
ncbi:RNApolymerase 14 kDa subunit [Arabidopsis thaliana]|uniref:RNApolymerase 14 kDa subunit n=1 Tax=Arabidopsis thaliana TaxID=3702 RepID=A8MRK9_ARATH|nr:RNApolymerase 14 kDa subunit [Arabidopsis thaliana]AEC08271.1 RNApolymerase 14 kDa subunit [Arabidopsis thaliana]|eukprot:NP_001077977.1 RNApolymerase 14 kDa subunit [Arabidopsis thaliana]